MLNNDGSVEISTTGSGSGSQSTIDLESNTDELKDDCDTYDTLEYVDSVRPSELLDSDVKSRLVGVATSDMLDTVGGSMGTGVRGGKGECGAVIGAATDAGMVLILSTDDAEPLGRNMDVSKLFSAASGSAMDSVEGEACRMEDS